MKSKLQDIKMTNRHLYPGFLSHHLDKFIDPKKRS